MGKKSKPRIIFTRLSPYMVTDLEHFEDHGGNRIDTAPVMELCRCGESCRKPFCDGSHSRAGFVGDKREGRLPDRVKSYRGAGITIHDNRGVCSHDAACIRCLPQVFRKELRPWIDPDGAVVEEIIRIIERCPSGALSYSIGGRHFRDQKRNPRIRVSKYGPLEITGGIILKDDMESVPASREHYALCRCGKTRNAPFCDGSHFPVQKMKE
ncbi:MAG: CDGSH iron-sulfur domain-containing protein [Spirochaetes bacterium]|nr:CDGSH iron-sulfur domain-containing protein [Spirochaetota bacterium]